MKKTVITVLFGMICGLLLCFNSKTALSASATNDLTVKITPVSTAAEAAAYSDPYTTILPGDYLVTLSVENNTAGISSIGATIQNSTYYEAIGDNLLGGVYTYQSPNTFKNFMGSVVYDTSTRKVGISLMRMTPVTTDGEIVNYFLRPTSNNIPTFAHILTDFDLLNISDSNSNEATNQFNYDTSLYLRGYRFLIGEIDDDGVITAMDASYLQDVIDYFGNISVNNSNASYMFYYMDCYGMFSDDATFCFAVGDVNEDGVINMTDVNLILSYVSNPSPTSIIGTYIMFYSIMPY